MRSILILLVLVMGAFSFPGLVFAALININTADKATLDTLPGIGPAKADAIIEYREKNGPFAKKEDIQNVSGIGAATYADVEALITVGSAVAEVSNDEDAVADSAPQDSVLTKSGGSKEPPIPEDARISIGGDRTLVAGAETEFLARVFEPGGVERENANVYWAFGDGASVRGRRAKHTYQGEGEYLVTACVQVRKKEEVCASLTARVYPAAFRVVWTAGGIALTNESPRTVDISGWRVTSGERTFLIPNRTSILGGKTITLPREVTGLSPSGDMALTVSSGAIAALWQTPRALAVKPGTPPAPLSEGVAAKKQTAPDAYEKELLDAPAAQASLAAAGAAIPQDPPLSEESKDRSFFSSAWAWGIGGIVSLAAAGAFIFL